MYPFSMKIPRFAEVAWSGMSGSKNSIEIKLLNSDETKTT